MFSNNIIDGICHVSLEKVEKFLGIRMAFTFHRVLANRVYILDGFQPGTLNLLGSTQRIYSCEIYIVA